MKSKVKKGNSMKAPAWFVDVIEGGVKLVGEQVKNLGISEADWLKLRKKGENVSLSDVRKICRKRPVGTLNFNMLAERLREKYILARADYAWAKFRYENLDNDFGLAEDLHYDEKKKLIIIVKK